MKKFLKVAIKATLYLFLVLVVIGAGSYFFIMKVKARDAKKRDAICNAVKTNQDFNVYNFIKKNQKNSVITVQLVNHQQDFYDEKIVLNEEIKKNYNKMSGVVELVVGKNFPWRFFCKIELESGVVTKVTKTGID